MNPQTEVNLTEDEAELYDRQIRLWGLEAQQRLRKAKILLIGMSPTAAEIAKNIMLSGINSLTLVDDKDVTEEDLKYNFLLMRETVGTNRTLSCFVRCQELNPMVHLEAKNQDFASLTADELRAFDAVCLAAERPTRERLLALSASCRAAGRPLIVADALGPFAFAFADLGEHQFAEEVVPVPLGPAASDGEGPAAKRAKTDATVDAEPKMVKKSLKFCALDAALDVEWASATPRALRRLAPVFFVVQAALGARQEAGKDGAAEMKEAWARYCERQKISASLLSEDDISRSTGVVPPVFPVIGGLVSQEIIKTVSHKDPPLKNFIFFNADDCSGSVHDIGPHVAS